MSQKAFKCGQCGQDNKKKDAKPNAPADCPMMKARCPGAMDKLTDMVKGGSEGKGSSSVVDRIKNFFGGKVTSNCRKVNYRILISRRNNSKLVDRTWQA